MKLRRGNPDWDSDVALNNPYGNNVLDQTDFSFTTSNEDKLDSRKRSGIPGHTTPSYHLPEVTAGDVMDDDVMAFGSDGKAVMKYYLFPP